MYGLHRETFLQDTFILALRKQAIQTKIYVNKYNIQRRVHIARVHMFPANKEQQHKIAVRPAHGGYKQDKENAKTNVTQLQQEEDQPGSKLQPRPLICVRRGITTH